jgi:hypothetical protein
MWNGYKCSFTYTQGVLLVSDAPGIRRCVLILKMSFIKYIWSNLKVLIIYECCNVLYVSGLFLFCPAFSVLGIQGHLWSETALTDDNFYYLVFPRLLALAERAWHKANWESSSVNRHNEMMKDWDNFASGVGSRELKRLDDMGITYRVSPPGARYSSYVYYIQ